MNQRTIESVAEELLCYDRERFEAMWSLGAKAQADLMLGLLAEASPEFHARVEAARTAYGTGYGEASEAALCGRTPAVLERIVALKADEGLAHAYGKHLEYVSLVRNLARAHRMAESEVELVLGVSHREAET